MTFSNKVVSGFAWKFFERIGAQGVTFIVSLVLARLLEPSTYGVIALVTVFITILQVFVDSGLGSALVQKKDADNIDFSTVFYFNIVSCLLLYVIIYFLAPLLAGFFRESELTQIIRVLSIVLIVSGVRNVQQAYVSRNLLFRNYFWATLGGTLGGAVVGLYMAIRGYEVWSLVAQQLTNSIVSTLLLWLNVKWRPSILFSFHRLKKLFSFGWKLLASSLLNTIYIQLRKLIIGKVYTEADLAFYNKGDEVPYMAMTCINTSMDSVILPTMSQEQDDASRIKQMARRTICIATYITAPMMIGLAVCAEPLVRILFTDKWIDSVFYVRIFCITYIFQPIHTTNLNAMKALGRSDWFLRLEVVKKIVDVVILVATMFVSIKAMAYSLLVGILLGTLINTYPNKKLINYGWLEQMKDIIPNIILAVIMGIPVYLIQYFYFSDIITLVLQVIVGILIYIILSVLIRHDTYFYLLNMMKKFREKKTL